LLATSLPLPLLLLPLSPLAGVPAAVPCLLLLLLLLLLLFLPLPKGSDASAATSVTGKEALRAAETGCAFELADLVLPLPLALLVSLPLA
jgi:hypothetical protein